MARIAYPLEMTRRPLEKTLCNCNIRAQVLQKKQVQWNVWNITAASLESFTVK